MELPEDDEQYLKEKQYHFDVQPDGDGGLLILRDYAVDGERYDPAMTHLMVRIPAQYPNANLDMFYADPPLKLKDGKYPERADHFEDHGGRRWQRFSRHLPGWRAGIDGLPTLLTFAHRELRKAS